MRILVAGWFSFPEMGASAGDLLARDLVCQWLNRAGLAFDIATAEPFTGGKAWQELDPVDYSHVVFVCGPFGNGPPVDAMLERFSACRWIGVNLSMLQELEQWNPFAALFERDSSRMVRPDLTFLSDLPRAPVVGVILVHPQKEYGKRGMHQKANDAIADLLYTTEAARVIIDTRLDHNTTGLRTPAEVEGVIARMDMVVTTRLHGTVLALKNGVPALAVDPIAGGAKIKRQTAALSWPVCLTADELDSAALRQAYDYCVSPQARHDAITCRQRARERLGAMAQEFVDAVRLNENAAHEMLNRTRF